MLLSKTDIARILRPISGAAKFDDSDYLKARAIEAATIAAYEAKLREQEPVAYMNSDSFDKLLSTISCWTLVQKDSDAGFDMPLYAEPRPAPIPEGWKELMIRTISRMRAAHVPCADIERSAEAMLAAARSGE